MTLNNFVEKKKLVTTNIAKDGFIDYEGPKGGTYRAVQIKDTNTYGIYSTSGMRPGRTYYVGK